MKVDPVYLVYFSPTGTTRTVLEGIAGGLGAPAAEHFDLTPHDAKPRTTEFRDGFAVVGIPVYAGRVPRTAVERLQRFRARETLAVLVVVYGNREYEDALMELNNVATDIGFAPIAGAAFIGEHTANYVLDDDTAPIAEGRPDVRDIERAIEFGRAVLGKARGIRRLEEIGTLELPGSIPYREHGRSSAESPVTDEAPCIRCGVCAAVCPVGAITLDSRVTTDQKQCIMCCACIKYCSTGARVGGHIWMREIGEWLSAEYSDPKEPEFFLR
ncbi:MAG: EFR1 family ferrodoxin [Bacillota bacterium]